MNKPKRTWRALGHRIEEQVEMGDWVKMCMQCGVCSGSCPTNFQSAWEHPPQEHVNKRYGTKLNIPVMYYAS